MNQKAVIYKYLSLIKLILGIIILFIDYSSINVFEDPIVAIGVGLIGAFLFFWGASFFLFFYIQRIFKNIDSIEILYSDSYKLSFLFGMFALLNILLIFLRLRNRILGLILLVIFLFVLYKLSLEKPKNARKQ